MSAFNFKYRIGLLALEVVMVLCRICSADAQTDEDFTPETLSRRCSKNTLIPCITSDCSPERSISGVICNFAVFALSSWVAVVKQDPFVYLSVCLFICFTTLVFRLLYSHVSCYHWESFTVRSHRFAGRRTCRPGLAELHYLTSCKPLRALHQADSPINKPASMLVFFDLYCD